MTFTVLGTCPRSGQVGIGIATASIAVGGLCPFYTLGGDIVSSQAYARPEVGLAVARHLADSNPLSALAELLPTIDSDSEFRQVGVITRGGEIWVHSGTRCRAWSGHRMSTHCAVMGNVLAGPQVLDAMLGAFEGSPGAALGERLLRALEAGRDAGGQADAQGRALTERSSALRVVGAGDLGGIDDPAVAPLDLRVDLSSAAVDELRRVFALCRLVPTYNALRSSRPGETPALGTWEQEHSPGVPPVWRTAE